MVLALVVSLVAGQSLAELKLDPLRHRETIIENVTEGFGYLPFSRYSTTVVNVVELPAEARVALTREALEQIKAFVMSEAGRAAWKVRLSRRSGQTVAERSASVASRLAYASTLLKESTTKEQWMTTDLEAAQKAAAQFKRDRAQLEKEERTRVQAAAALDDAAFAGQLKERLTLFLAETKTIPWGTKLIEKDGRKFFADQALELKPKWWKLCFRAGPEATAAAREFATAWLAELSAPARLSDEK
jgi:hypothetical protein